MICIRIIVTVLMFLQGYHGLLSQSMTTERMYGKILTVCSLIHYSYILRAIVLVGYILVSLSIIIVSLHLLSGYLSGARCRFAYGLADATATHYLLLQ